MPHLHGSRNAMIPKALVALRHEDYRKNIAEYLRLCGFHVVEAATGYEAQEIVLTGTPDLLLCEPDLGDIDAFELLQNIRVTADISAQRLPCILLFSRLSEEEQKRSARSGIAARIAKTAPLDALHHALYTLFPRHCRQKETRPN